MMMGERGAELVVSTPTTHVTDWVSLFRSYCMPAAPKIENVIFHDPATIVYWVDGTKTVVKVRPGDTFDRWTGLAMAHMKKMYGEAFHSEFRKWCSKEVLDGSKCGN